ncbi:FxSxx-COOH system tetratricopeptide repeat protein [Streptomyces tanashiensis]|uniref:FxSxx-COOH system tetratricopeptide repeat protein n=1 Tax=Streptomyces tanashiensis TaxID=67367 RepID=UPI0034067681
MNVSGDRPIGAESVQVALSGDHAQVTVLPEQAAHWARTVEVPAGAGFLPESASGLFVGREEELTSLRRMLTGEGAAAVVQPHRTSARAISGLGGVGKSALALHYAHRYRDSYALVWWVSAESPETIVTGLGRITEQLCPQWARGCGPEDRAAWAIAWLQAHLGWLLVFDNVEDPSHLHPYLGTLSGGHHLATSRRATGWHALAPVMPLGTLPPDEATGLLCSLAFPGQTATAEQREAARRLAEDLGCLPLALEQAGAYAYRTGIDLDTYRRSLALVLDDNRDALSPERTIARIWDHTLTALTARDPLAVTLLHTMAWLAPDGIPRSLLAPLAPHPLALANALGELHAYNMIAFTPDRQGVGVHRLVQTVLRNRNPQVLGRTEAEQAVRQALPLDHSQPDDTIRWERLLPHVYALADTTPTDAGASVESVDTYEMAAQYLYRQGRQAHTTSLREQALTQYVELLGDTHPDTLTSRNNLANAYESAGDLERAIPLHETTLAQCVAVLGDTHRTTLNSRCNLAGAYRQAGDLGRAIPLYETTLAQRVELLGDTHPDTLISRNNLAGAYQEAGDLGRAIPLYETTLAQRVEALGDTHPSSLNSRSNLASAYESAGDLERAIPLYETALAQRVEALGDTHPLTLNSRNNLASAYKSAGHLRRAIPLHETTLAQYVEALGDTHPSTLTSRSNLAYAYESAGDLERAIPLFETTLAQRVEVLGDRHPDTLTSRNNLASAYESAGDLERAIPLHETTLAQYVEALGDTYPDTLTSRSNLAYAYESAGDLERAISLFETTLAQRMELLGDTHPSTLTSRNNLAYAYESAGDLERAIPLYETTLAQRVELLGNTHPSTLTSRNNLAYAYESAGDLERAILLHETTLAQRVELLGDTHPDTLVSRNNLASAYESAGDLERAIPLYETTLAQRVELLGNTHPDTLISRNNLASALKAAKAEQHSDTATGGISSGSLSPPPP